MATTGGPAAPRDVTANASAPMPAPAVTLCQLTAVEGAFDSRVFRNASGKKQLERPTFQFSISSLRSFIASRPCTDSTALLLVRYGLTSQFKMTYGLAITCAVPSGTQPFTEPTIHHVPNGGLHLAPWSGASGQTWKGTFGNVYAKVAGGANVYIKRSANIQAFDPAKDTYYVTFSITRVQEFLDHNEDHAGARRATHVELVSYADPKATDHYHHGVMLVARDEQGRMIDDATWPHTYAMRGLNLSTPCPDHCCTFMLLTTGLGVSGCP